MSDSHFLGMRMLLLSWQITDINIFFTEYILSVVLRFLQNLFCSSDSCASYHGLICSKMILMITIDTADSILSRLYLPGPDLDLFPFQRVLSLELP